MFSLQKLLDLRGLSVLEESRVTSFITICQAYLLSLQSPTSVYFSLMVRSPLLHKEVYIF